MIKRKILTFSILLLVGLSVPAVIFGAGGGAFTPVGGGGGGVGSGGGGGTSGFPNPIGINTVQELVARLLSIVVAIGAPIVIFALVYCGFLFVTARGNENTLARAKNAFLWTVIGGLILLGAQGLANVVCSTINEVSGQNSVCQ